MSTARTLFFSCSLMAAALSLPLGCGDDETTTGGVGGDDRIPCERTADCEDNNSCTFDNCILPEGYCTFSPVQGRDPDAEQTDGNCLEIVCDDGVSVEAPDDDDPPDDANNDDCIVPACMDGMAVDGMADAGDGCDFNGIQGVCDGMGTCSCQAPAVGDPHFVDPVEGTDAPTQGGAPGACAYKTIGYALSQAEGEIRLAFGTYDASNTTFPIVLQGERRIICQDDGMDVRGTIRGSGDHMGTQATIVFAGTNSEVRGCELDGNGTAAAVVLSTTLPGGNNNHNVRDCDLHGGTDGVVLRQESNDLDIDDSILRDFTGRAVAIERVDPNDAANVDINDNMFSNNTIDVECADTADASDGENNQGIDDCVMCQNCPF